MVNSVPVITIDGRSSCGKGTIALALAQKLRWHYLDSGTLYRALALAATHHHIDCNDHQALAALAVNVNLEVISNNIGQKAKIFLAGLDVTASIYSEALGGLASKISAIKAVRKALMPRQQLFRKSPGLVTDGRDMGTVVFPDAKLKIFLSASAKECAKRRYQQLKQQGIDVKLAQLVTALAKRDARDEQRNVSPLVAASDAVCIDTSELAINEVLRQVAKEVKRYLGIELSF